MFRVKPGRILHVAEKHSLNVYSVWRLHRAKQEKEGSSTLKVPPAWLTKPEAQRSAGLLQGHRRKLGVHVRMNFQPLFEFVGGFTFIQRVILHLTIQPSLNSISYMVHTRVHV